jgi:spore germination protein KC
MKKIILLLMIAAVCLSSGCSQLSSSRIEIDRVFIVRVIAIDKISDNKVRLTLTSKNINPSQDSQASGSSKSEILISEGETVFDAARYLMTHSNKRPHFGHTEFILFGEETAKDGILPYLDFISRNSEFRYNAKIYIVRGDTASGLIMKSNTGNAYLGDKISSLEDDANFLSVSVQVSLNEAIYIFSKNNISTYIPYLEVKDNFTGSLGISSDMADLDKISMHGYAIFKNDKLYDFLDNEYSMGVNFVRNIIDSGVILIEASDGKKISFEILHNKTKLYPSIEENGLSCTVKVKVDCNIAETMSKVDITNPQVIADLEAKLDEAVKTKLEKIISYAQENNVDIFSILTAFIIKYPSARNELRDKWGQLFPELNFKVDVRANINRSQLLNDAAGSR